MADENIWEKIRKELASPWDWVAAGVGAAGGLGVSIFVGGADLGTSAAIGALAVVSARKAGAASLRGRNLAKRAHGLLHVLKQRPAPESSAAPPVKYSRMIQEVERDLELWERRVISHDHFDTLLNQHIDNYRKLS